MGSGIKIRAVPAGLPAMFLILRPEGAGPQLTNVTKVEL